MSKKKPVPVVSEAKTIGCYGLTLADNPGTRQIMGDAVLRELWFFKHAPRLEETDYNGPGRAGHSRLLDELLWQQKGREVYESNPWSEEQDEAYCEVQPEVSVTGASNCSKTSSAAKFAVKFMLCDPENTGVLMAGPIRDQLKKSLWADTQKFFNAAPFRYRALMRLVPSDMKIFARKGDDKHVIAGIAVAGGEEQKAMGRINGFHPRRLLVVIDEATDVSDAIVQACVNLSTNKEEFLLIALGNAASIFDSHGRLCEPEEGWGSINTETHRWRTKRGGVCLHFDALKSPNVEAGEDIYKFLIKQRDIDRTAAAHGEDSPQFWRMRRGFWCPEGTIKSILSEPEIQKFQCQGNADWQGLTIKGAALDPAFEGGDRCILRFGKWGMSASGVNTIEFGRITHIKTSVTAKEPIHYQIARQVKEECEKEGVEPENFQMDTTGEGGGLHSILMELWSHRINKCEFGGAASDLAASTSDMRPAREVYRNKVTELWYSFREAVRAGQIRGLDAETCVEFCRRLYEVKERICVLSKSEYKKVSNGKSCDLSDAAVVFCDMVRRKGGLGKLSNARIEINREWNNLVKEFDVYDQETAYSEDSVDALM